VLKPNLSALTARRYSTFAEISERVESNGHIIHAHTMSQSLAKILVHVVFSTKDRRPFPRDQLLREELHH
jgi:hypothetical protein